MSGLERRPVRSCSMYSKTRCMLQESFEVTKPWSLMTLGWSSLLSIRISLAMNLTLSGSKLSNFTFFKATILPVSVSRARNTLLYVPWPIFKNHQKQKKSKSLKKQSKTEQNRVKQSKTEQNRAKQRIVKVLTFSSFSKASERNGTQPWIASPATLLSQEGQPAATCSASKYLLKLPRRKLNDSLLQFELARPDSVPNSLPPLFFLLLLFLPLLLLQETSFFSTAGEGSSSRIRPDPEQALLFLNTPEWSIAGVTETVCFELTQPITQRILAPPRHHHMYTDLYLSLLRIRYSNESQSSEWVCCLYTTFTTLQREKRMFFSAFFSLSLISGVNYGRRRSFYFNLANYECR